MWEGGERGGELERRERYLKMNPINKEVVNYHPVVLAYEFGIKLAGFQTQNLIMAGRVGEREREGTSTPTGLVVKPRGVNQGWYSNKHCT